MLRHIYIIPINSKQWRWCSDAAAGDGDDDDDKDDGGDDDDDDVAAAKAKSAR
jgi:hypothetical protein